MAFRHRFPDELAAATGRPEASPRRAAPAILGLQARLGNTTVSRMLADAAHRSPPAPAAMRGQVEDSETTFDVTIPRRARGEMASPPTVTAEPVPAHEHDAEGEDAQGGEVDPATITAAFMAQLRGSAAPAAGAGGRPGQAEAEGRDLFMPAELATEDHDRVTSTITYEPTIAQSGTVRPFGSTTWANFNILGLVVRSTPGAFGVTFRLQNPITYNVSSSKTSIASADDPALTSTNYRRAAADLTPDMSRQNGKPPRRQFWTRDLTLRHERFHSNERRRLNRAGATQAQRWLSAQTATTAAEVQALVAQVPARVVQASQAAVGTLDEKESRAYGDGAPLYRARAAAIRTKGSTAPGYPAP